MKPPNFYNQGMALAARWLVPAFTAALLSIAFTGPARGAENPPGPGPGVVDEQRYIDHGDQTITDTRSGLMWTKKDSRQITGKWISWLEARPFVEELNKEGYANHHDWQVPTKKELQTLYEPNKINSKQVGREMNIHIDPIFAKEGAGSHWALESNGSFNGFGVTFSTGKVFSASKKSRARKSVRAVRPAGN